MIEKNNNCGQTLEIWKPASTAICCVIFYNVICSPKYWLVVHDTFYRAVCGTLAMLTHSCLSNTYAKMLYNDLLRRSGYNKLIRPVVNITDVLTVKVGLKLSQLIDIVSRCVKTDDSCCHAFGC